jgi:hypothetical protein
LIFVFKRGVFFLPPLFLWIVELTSKLLLNLLDEPGWEIICDNNDFFTSFSSSPLFFRHSS